jgi:hypothetical protein
MLCEMMNEINQIREMMNEKGTSRAKATKRRGRFKDLKPVTHSKSRQVGIIGMTSPIAVNPAESFNRDR